VSLQGLELAGIDAHFYIASWNTSLTGLSRLVVELFNYLLSLYKGVLVIKDDGALD